MKSLIIGSCLVFGCLVLFGCSNDPSQPSRHLSLFNPKTATIGPSEIVLCIDVSDSISSSELSDVVTGLSTCLSDPNAIPQNGMVSITAVVYADSIASLFSNPVPITSQSLTGTILPALTGLLQNRKVPTNGFDLSGALQEAGTILGGAQVSDRQVLIVS